MPKVVITAALALSLVFIAAPAQAEQPDTVQDQIDHALSEIPGGVQTGSNTVEWEDGAVTLTVADPNGSVLFAVGSCATGAYCAYSDLSLTGSKLSFTTCNTTVSTAALLTGVRSIANARSTGYVQAKNGSGTTLATIYAGGQLNSAPTGVIQLRCVS